MPAMTENRTNPSVNTSNLNMVPGGFVISRSPVQVGSPAPQSLNKFTDRRRTCGTSISWFSGKICAAILLFLFIPRSTLAQSLKLPIAVFGVAAAGDWTATGYNITHGGAEGNRWLKPLADRPALMITAGAAIDVAGAVVWSQLVGRHHPKIAAIGFYALAAYRSWLIVRNMRAERLTPCRQPLCLR